MDAASLGEVLSVQAGTDIAGFVASVDGAAALMAAAAAEVDSMLLYLPSRWEYSRALLHSSYT